MAKKNYKIPTSLDATYFDMEFNLKSKNGVGINHPVSAKVIIFSLLSMFGWFYLTFQTFIGQGSVLVAVGFSITWLIMSFLLIKQDKSKRMGLELVLTMINYLPKSNRNVSTRLADNVMPLKQITNIDKVDEEDGMIHFLDGYVGHVYHIVGSASTLMFDHDKKIILRKVDSFYRKLPVGIDVIYDTVYEGHSVHEQLATVREDAKNLRLKSKGLQALLKERHDILKYAIDDNKDLASLHQYLVVRAPNGEGLREFENLLVGDIEGEGLMFRLAWTLDYEDTVRYLNSIIA